MKNEYQNLFFTLGRPFGPLYGLAMQARARFYEKGLCKQHRLSVPVISVGNLTLGGTGKTPLVMFLASLLLEHGYRPAVVSRGYGGSARAPVNIVSDGGTPQLSPGSAGDEPYLIAAAVPGTVVATGRKRIVPCRHVIQRYGCDVILLDDGFQHLSVSRTVDLVLFDVGSFTGNGRVFPGGCLREPFSALKRGDAFVLTNVIPERRQLAVRRERMLRQLCPGTPVFTVSRRYRQLSRMTLLSRGPSREPTTLTDMPALLYGFSGIARPERFVEALSELTIRPAGFTMFDDHHRYRQEDLEYVCDKALESGADGLITTEKDAVKIARLEQCRLPLYIPTLEIVGADDLETFILTELRKKSA